MDLETIWVAKRQIESQTETDPPAPEIEDVAAPTGSSPTTRSACCGWPSSC